MKSNFDLRGFNLGCALNQIVSLERVNEEYIKLAKSDLRAECCESIKTSKELLVYSKLQKATKLRIYRSFWIGNHNFDFFINGVGEGDIKGLAIEVDGSIHDREFKMRKDEHKGRLLGRLGIAHYSVLNHDLNSSDFRGLLRELPKMRRHDSRCKQRVMRNIKILCLVAHFSLEEWIAKFGEGSRILYSKAKSVL